MEHGAKTKDSRKTPMEVARAATDELAPPYLGQEGSHDYDIGPTPVCLASECSERLVQILFQKNGIPFSFMPATEGSWAILGSQPILHESFGPNLFTNTTITGHTFHPGRVINYTFEHEGMIYIYSRGVGTGWNPHNVNEFIGQIFNVLHNDVVRYAQAMGPRALEIERERGGQ